MARIIGAIMPLRGTSCTGGVVVVLSLAFMLPLISWVDTLLVGEDRDRGIHEAVVVWARRLRCHSAHSALVLVVTYDWSLAPVHCAAWQPGLEDGSSATLWQ